MPNFEVKKFCIKTQKIVMFKRKLVEYNFNFKGLIPNLDTAREDYLFMNKNYYFWSDLHRDYPKIQNTVGREGRAGGGDYRLFLCHDIGG